MCTTLDASIQRDFMSHIYEDNHDNGVVDNIQYLLLHSTASRKKNKKKKKFNTHHDGI